MILRYLNCGVRRLGETPVLPHSRVSWEFFAVVDGRCGMHCAGDEKLPLEQSHLWLAPPHHLHGWHGPPGESCEIVVFHFDSVPAALEALVPPDGFYECSLSSEACFSLVQIEADLEDEFKSQTSFSDLHFQRALLDLTLLALHREQAHELETGSYKNADRVQAALTWYRRNLREHPNLSQMARAVHVSVSHLRRLFLQVRHQTPGPAMQGVRIESALNALSDTDAKIDSIAVECGFGSGSDFCRAFKSLKGCTPSEWRRQLPHPPNEIESCVAGNTEASPQRA